MPPPVLGVAGEATLARKDQHLDLCLHEDIGARVTTGFERYRLRHRALPELDLAEVSLETELLGKRLRAPLIIAGMTGGTERGGEVNRRLARAAARTGIALGLGSGRSLVERPEAAATFDVREQAGPATLILANVGAVQLGLGFGRDELVRVVRACRADALALHLNALQEAVQPEGQPRFKGLAARLAEVLPALPFPCLLKETGSGFSEEDARVALAVGAAGVDVSGAGGTSWARVEGHRGGARVRALGEAFGGWGIPTAESVVRCRAVLPERSVLIASGGISSGIDAAKALALGADAVAVARPFLKAAHEGEDALVETIERWKKELQVALFCTGSSNVAALRARGLERIS
ncbi:type 2 isopentenyl-diphosphate Delta-isomerase [bacterium]|nr:type 2 isopentenyl-diphosphate Delta-isomerase [bacterium]